MDTNQTLSIRYKKDESIDIDEFAIALSEELDAEIDEKYELEDLTYIRGIAGNAYSYSYLIRDLIELRESFNFSNLIFETGPGKKNTKIIFSDLLVEGTYRTKKQLRVDVINPEKNDESDEVSEKIKINLRTKLSSREKNEFLEWLHIDFIKDDISSKSLGKEYPIPVESLQTDELVEKISTLYNENITDFLKWDLRLQAVSDSSLFRSLRLKDGKLEIDGTFDDENSYYRSATIVDFYPS